MPVTGIYIKAAEIRIEAQGDAAKEGAVGVPIEADMALRRVDVAQRALQRVGFSDRAAAGAGKKNIDRA